MKKVRLSSIHRNLFCVLALCLAAPLIASAQPVFRNVFPPEEFAARRAKVFEVIGDGVAILEGTTERPGEQPFRQANQFFYLTGVMEPRAIALLDGRTKETTIFLLPEKPLDVSSKYGPGALYPCDESARQLGVTKVLPREDLTAIMATIGRECRPDQRRNRFTPHPSRRLRDQ